jgi:uncharacterized protein
MMNRVAMREFHAFEAAGRRFLYLVPSAAVVQIDDAADAVLATLGGGPRSRAEIADALAGRFPRETVVASIDELLQVRALGPAGAPPERTLKVLPSAAFPLSTMVLNVTSKCNLACKYCYEYGEDRIPAAAATPMPRFLSEETARQSVDFMFARAAANPVVYLTFFGGETLLNFDVLKSTLAYARQRAADNGKHVEFSITTNGTLLRPDVIEWLADNDVAVTISIDGPKDMQDRFRVFHNGRGSYDVMMPKVRALLQRHTSRPIGARVTLTRQNLDVLGIYRHLTGEIGFREVGFAPVTTSQQRDHAIGDDGYDRMLEQFGVLAHDFLDHALAGRHHGFSNVKDTLEEIHKGMSKAYPCGAGMGLVGVATDGSVSLCHRFAGSPEHQFGSVTTGVDAAKQQAFMERHHLADKTDCSRCWARPICAGGCYHEAHTRYGTTERANLHYCDWIRSWTDLCLRIYGELAERNPAWLARFDHGLSPQEVA